jgi:hypothetical protein
MRPFRTRLSRRQAAQLLDHPELHADDPVGAVLAAAGAPPAESTPEVAGEDLASAAFRAARPGSVPVAASPLARGMRKLAAAPVAALTAAGLVLAGGGLAIAASQGAVHVPFTGHDHRSGHAPSAPTSTNPGLTHTTGSSASESTEPTAGPTHLPSASPSPSLAGLCRAFQAGATHDGKANPAFSALYAAAGGVAATEAFCTNLIGPAPTHPTHPTHPVKPTQAPTSHPTHPAKPTQAPTSHPTHPVKPTRGH